MMFPNPARVSHDDRRFAQYAQTCWRFPCRVGRQKARICSNSCRLADAKPTCVAAKTRNSLASRREADGR